MTPTPTHTHTHTHTQLHSVKLFRDHVYCIYLWAHIVSVDVVCTYLLCMCRHCLSIGHMQCSICHFSPDWMGCQSASRKRSETLSFNPKPNTPAKPLKSEVALYTTYQHLYACQHLYMHLIRSGFLDPESQAVFLSLYTPKSTVPC